MTRAALFAILLLSSCAAIPAAPDIQASCLPLATYTTTQQAQLANELTAIPSNSMTVTAILDYEKMRDADRACISSTTKGAK